MLEHFQKQVRARLPEANEVNRRVQAVTVKAYCLQAHQLLKNIAYTSLNISQRARLQAAGSIDNSDNNKVQTGTVKVLLSSSTALPLPSDLTLLLIISAITVTRTLLKHL